MAWPALACDLEWFDQGQALSGRQHRVSCQMPATSTCVTWHSKRVKVKTGEPDGYYIHHHTHTCPAYGSGSPSDGLGASWRPARRQLSRKHQCAEPQARAHGCGWWRVPGAHAGRRDGQPTARRPSTRGPAPSFPIPATAARVALAGRHGTNNLLPLRVQDIPTVHDTGAGGQAGRLRR